MPIPKRDIYGRPLASDEHGKLLRLTTEEVRKRNAEAIAALDAVAEMGTEEEQRETLDALMKGLAESGADSDWTPDPKPNDSRRRSFDERGRLLPKTPEQMEEYKARAIRALDDIAQIGTEEERLETYTYLMEIFGPDRNVADRPLSP